MDNELVGALDGLGDYMKKNMPDYDEFAAKINYMWLERQHLEKMKRRGRRERRKAIKYTREHYPGPPLEISP